MAKYYSLVYSSFAADFKAALEDYYGDGVTVTSASGNKVVFSCPQICDKPLTISLINPYSGASVKILQGVFDATTFITGSGSVSVQGGVEGIDNFHLVLADSFLLVQMMHSNKSTCCTSILIAKTTNGRYLCMGGSNGNTGINGQCWFTDDTTSRPVWFMVPYQKQLRFGKKIPIVKAQLAVAGQVEMNDDGTLAHIDGLYLTGETSSGGAVGLNYFLSHGIIRGNSTNGVYMPNAFYVEVE